MTYGLCDIFNNDQGLQTLIIVTKIQVTNTFENFFYFAFQPLDISKR